MPIALRTSILCALLSLSLPSSAQQKPSPFVKQNAPVLVLDHVRLIVQAIQICAHHERRQNRRRQHSERQRRLSADAKVLDMTAKTIIARLAGCGHRLSSAAAQQRRSKI